MHFALLECNLKTDIDQSALDILVFGFDNDPHIHSVVNHLRNSGLIVEVLSPVSDHGDFDVSLQSSDGQISASVNGFRIDEEVKPLVWLRRKMLQKNYVDDVDQRLFLELHTRQTFVEGLIDLFDLPVINRGKDLLGSHEKISQISAAHKVGLRTPATIASTSKVSLLDFVSNQNSICKALGKNLVPGCYDGQGKKYDPIWIMTERITREEVNAHTEMEIASVPLLIQEEVRKSYELRVLAVGSEVFAFKIDSQKSELTSLDWRLGERDLSMYSYTTLSEELNERILLLLQHLDLDLGVLDFAVCDDGSEFFFECNPSGQWMALQKVEDAPDLSAAVARHFGRKASGN